MLWKLSSGETTQQIHRDVFTTAGSTQETLSSSPVDQNWSIVVLVNVDRKIRCFWKSAPKMAFVSCEAFQTSLPNLG